MFISNRRVSNNVVDIDGVHLMDILAALSLWACEEVFVDGLIACVSLRMSLCRVFEVLAVNIFMVMLSFPRVLFELYFFKQIHWIFRCKLEWLHLCGRPLIAVT